MSSNLSSGFLKLFSIQTGRAFPPFLSTLPHTTSRWWSSQSWPEHLVPSSGCSVLSHSPNITNWCLLPHHYAQGEPQDMMVRECVSNIDLHDIKRNVLVKDQGTQERNPSTICHSNTGAQLLLAFVPNCWLTLLYAFWAVSTCKRIRSLLLKSAESKDFTLPNWDGLCFVEPKYQLWG